MLVIFGLYKGIGHIRVDIGHVHAGQTVFTVFVEGPVGAVLFVNSGNAVDFLHIQTIRTFLALNQAQLDQRRAYSGLVGVNFILGLGLVQIYHGKLEDRCALTQDLHRTVVFINRNRVFFAAATGNRQCQRRNQHQRTDDGQPLC